MSTPSKKFGARIPEEMFRRLKVLAAQKGTSVQALLIEALRDLLKKRGISLEEKKEER